MTLTSDVRLQTFRRAIDRRLARLRLAPARRAEIVDELSQHLQDRYDELRAGGATDEQARCDVLQELEGHTLLAERLAATEARTNPDPRTTTDAASLTASIRSAIRGVNPNVPVRNVRTAEEILAASVGSRCFCSPSRSLRARFRRAGLRASTRSWP